MKIGIVVICVQPYFFKRYKQKQPPPYLVTSSICNYNNSVSAVVEVY